MPTKAMKQDTYCYCGCGFHAIGSVRWFNQQHMMDYAESLADLAGDVYCRICANWHDAPVCRESDNIQIEE